MHVLSSFLEEQVVAVSIWALSHARNYVSQLLELELLVASVLLRRQRLLDVNVTELLPALVVWAPNWECLIVNLTPEVRSKTINVVDVGAMIKWTDC